MNTPSAPVGNWSWRYPRNALHPDFSTQLAALMEMTDRDGYVAPEEDPEEAGKPTDLAAKRVEEGSLA
jgi:4-alpha-glucanotransferase